MIMIEEYIFFKIKIYERQPCNLYDFDVPTVPARKQSTVQSTVDDGGV